MGFDQYHEPPEELSPATRTFARLCASLTEEAEAIGWYEQRLAVEADREASAIMRDAQGEEFKHFCMDLEFLMRRTPLWREIARGILFQEGDIVEGWNLLVGLLASGIVVVLLSKVKTMSEQLEKTVENRTAALMSEVVERKRAEEAQRSLAAQLSAAEEAERTRLAADIHDSIGQSLSSELSRSEQFFR